LTLFVRSLLVSLSAFATLVAASYAAAVWPKAQSAGRIATPFAWTDALSWCEHQENVCASRALVPLAHRAPLSPKPFAAKVREALEDGDTEAATGLSAELLKRDPRSVVARLVLAEAALREKDTQRFAELYFPLFEIRRSEATSYANLLAGLSDDQAVYKQVATKLKEAPYWGPRYLMQISDMGVASPAELISLYKYFPNDQGTFLTNLTRTGRWDLAYIAFVEFNESLPSERRLQITSPFNPSLVANSAPSPFNWHIDSKGGEFLANEGVYFYYQGRIEEVLLSQSFPLIESKYEFEVMASGQASPENGWFQWQLKCSDGKKVLAEFDISTLSSTPGELRFSFDGSDAECAFVTLTLLGVPGDFPAPSRIRIGRVKLLHIGSSK